MKSQRIDKLQHMLPGNAQSEEDEVDLADLFAQLAARRWFLLVFAVLGGVIGALIGQLGFDEFRADAVVQIEKRSTGVTLPEELIGNLLAGETNAESSFATEIHVIRSRLVLEPVVRRLNADVRAVPVRAPIAGALLARRPLPIVEPLFPAAYQRPGESIALGSMTVAEAWLGVPITLAVTGEDTFALSLANGASAEGRVGETVEIGDDIRLTVSEIFAPAGREYRVVREPVRRSVVRLREQLEIEERGSTGIVDFGFTSGDPEFSLAVVNTVVESYREQNLQRRSAEIDQSIEFIETKLPEIRSELDDATAALSAYRDQQENLELSLGTQELLDQVVEIQGQLEELGFEEQQLAQRLTPNHPDYQRLLAERERLEDRLADIREDLQNVPAAEQELARLQERVASARELERQLVARVEQLRVLKASAVGNIRVLEPAEAARLVGPDRIMPAGIGTGAGLAVAIILVFLLNLLRRGIEDARDVEDIGLSVFGSVTKVRKLAGSKAGHPEYALALHDPESMAVESLKGLRTGLRFTLAAHDAKTVMITSCAPSDGKSFISLNLALVNAQIGERVLLIDCDLRRGKLGRQFGVSRRSDGLSQVLVGECDLLEAIREEPTSGLHFLGTGGLPPNPAELLESQNFSQLLAEASEHYDLVILDAPPILAVTDPAIVGQKADVSLLVVRHLVTTKAELQSALKSLSNAGITPSGAVINQYDIKRSRYGQYGTRYGYHYGAYSYRYKPESK